MREIIHLAQRAASSDSNILLEGETGTGKELFAEFKKSYSKDEVIGILRLLIAKSEIENHYGLRIKVTPEKKKQAKKTPKKKNKGDSKKN